MRPLLLKMSAFGPYKNEVTIDFEKLGENGLYLICGDTGSGKSFIFDGICYALYDSSSTSERSQSNLRSAYADIDTKTFVELEFLYRNKKYKIRRNPAYERKKSRGEGTTKESSAVELHLPNGTILTNNKEVKDKIIEILGVDYNQFKQISMLPQGQFKELLQSSTTDRINIFRKIFNTIPYANLGLRISDDVKNLRQLHDNIYNSISQYINDIEISTDSIYFNKFIEAKNDNNTLVESSILDEIINEDSKLLDSVNNIILKKQKEIEELKIKINKIEDKKLKIKQIDADKLNFENIKKELSNLNYDTNKKEKEIIKSNLEKEFNSLNDKKKDYIKLDKLALDLKTNQEQLIKINNEIENNNDKLILSNEILSYKKSKKESLKNIELDINNLINYLKELKSSYDLIKTIETKINDVRKIDEALNNYEKDILENLNNINSLIKELKNINDYIEIFNQKYNDFYQKNKINSLEKEINNKNNIIKIMDNIKMIDDNISSSNNKLINLQKEFEKINNDLIIISNKYNGEYKKYLDNQAGLLAKDLKEGMPCPVCGAIHHIKYAKARPDVLTKDDLDKLLKQKEDINIDVNNMLNNIKQLTKDISKLKEERKKILTENNLKEDELNNLNNLKTELTELLNALANLEKTKLKIDEEFKSISIKKELIEKILEQKSKLDVVFTELQIEKAKLEQERNIKKAEINKYFNDNNLNEESFNNKLKEIELLLNNKNNELINLKNDEKIKADLNSEIEKLEKDINDLTINKNKLDTILASLNSDKTNLNKQIEELKKELAYKDLNEVNNKLGILNNNINNISNDIIKLDKDKERLQTKYTELNTSINKLQIDISNINFNEAEIKTNFDLLNNEINKLNENKRIIDNRLNINNRCKNNINKNKKEFEDVERRYQDIKNLNDTINGSLAGRAKIPFETYILGTYFDKILIYANRRFLRMTKNHYEFVRSKDYSGGGKTGLDLDVIDHYNSSTRSVSTLSGGEQFTASLALALGLSDGISAENGGIKLDSIFIDEGFGSLSEEYLDTAINVLVELSNSDKTIAIISHVNELKTRIDKHIEVSKDSINGSKINIIA